MSTFNIFKSPVNGQYYYHLKANNGEKILSGEGYTTKDSCKAGIASVKLNAPNDSRYDRHHNSVNSYSFNLKATNGEIIGKSESYVTAWGRDNGISDVKNQAPGATVIDLA